MATRKRAGWSASTLNCRSSRSGGLLDAECPLADVKCFDARDGGCDVSLATDSPRSFCAAGGRLGESGAGAGLSVEFTGALHHTLGSLKTMYGDVAMVPENFPSCAWKVGRHWTGADNIIS